MDFGLKGKIALVTGGGRGIGRGCSLQLGAEGAHVVVNYVNDRDAAEKTAQDIRDAGGSAEIAQGDVGVYRDAEQVIEQALQRTGRIDVLVNNAGIVSRKPILDVPLDEWDRVIRTNIYGCFHCSRLAGKHMVEQKNGRIINISSIHGQIAKADMGPYSATKGAINQFTRQLAVELAPYAVTVNAISVGAISTEINEPLYRSTKPEDVAMQKAVIRRIPLGHIGEPENIGAVVTFLASKQACYMTGAIVYVDGGYSADGTARL